MTRAPRTTSLLSAAGLLLAVLVASAAPAHAAASTAVVTTSSYVDSAQTRHLVGEVRNTGDEPVVAPLIDLEVLDASGQVIDTQTVAAALAGLAPGEVSPFEGQTTNPAYASFRVVGASAQPSGVTPNHFLTPCVTRVFGNAGKSRQLSGQLRNDNQSSADAPNLFVTFYDAQGTALAFDQTSTDSSSSLAPGQSAAFSEIVSDDVPAYASYAFLAESDSRGDATSRSGCPATPAETTIDCNPTMTLSTHAIVTGQSVQVFVQGTPHSVVTLEGYSRPSTDYATIRKDVELDDAGQLAPFLVRPSTAARVRLQVRGCSTPGTGQVITVTPVLTITTKRLSAFSYLFEGKISPAVANTNRLVTLYYQATSSSAPVRKGTAHTLKDGRYSAKLAFQPGATKTLRFFWGTGADQTNSKATSAVRALVVY